MLQENRAAEFERESVDSGGLCDREQICDEEAFYAFPGSVSYTENDTHPNILEVVDFFSYGGSLYVIEEYLEWEPLSSAINDRSFSRRDAFAVGRQLLEAFSAENGLEGCNGCFDRICRLSRWISCENGSSLCHSGCGGSTDIIRLSRRCI